MPRSPRVEQCLPGVLTLTLRCILEYSAGQDFLAGPTQAPLVTGIRGSCAEKTGPKALK